MDNPRIIEQEISLAEQTEKVLVLYTDSIVEILESGLSERQKLASTVQSIFRFVVDRQQAIILLIKSNAPWDSEILLRSAMEGVVRILFLCYCNADERSVRISEYWQGLAQDNSVRQSRKAQICINSRRNVPNSNLGNAEVDVFVGIKQASSKFSQRTEEKSRKERQIISQKWSFTNIVTELDKFLSNKFNNAPLFEALLHNYGMSSHLIHVDESGIGLTEERFSRPIDEHEKLHIAHVCRLLSDLLSYFGLVAFALCDVTQIKRNLLETAVRKHDILTDQFKVFQCSFYDTQRDFYTNI